MKIITSVTAFNDSVGMRLSATYSEIDDNTGRITTDNKRFDRVVTNMDIKDKIQDLFSYASENIPEA